MYKYRWEVELFFRWFKKILKADKLLSLSKNGLTIIMYCALIASLPVVSWTGCTPGKRTFEMICLFFLGVAAAASKRRMAGIHVGTGVLARLTIRSPASEFRQRS
jgi:hypothetical protein